MKKNLTTVITFLILPILCLQIFEGCIHFRTGEALSKFRRFEFSNRDDSKDSCFSMLFLQSDTVFLKHYSVSSADSIFYTTVPKYERLNIDQFVVKKDSIPIDSLSDFNPSKKWIMLFFDYGNEAHTLPLHNLQPPMAFAKLNKWINKVKDSSVFKYIDTTIVFEEDKNIHEILNENRR